MSSQALVPQYKDTFAGTLPKVLEHIAMYIASSFYLQEMTDLYINIQENPNKEHTVINGNVKATYEIKKSCCKTYYQISIQNYSEAGS